MGESRERFVDLGRSAVPAAPTPALGTFPHPYVVQISVSGPRPYLAITVGSGHLGSGRVFPLDEVLLDTGDVDPRWAHDFDLAGATWALPTLRAVLDGAPVTEAQIVDGYRDQFGAEPAVAMLPVP